MKPAAVARVIAELRALARLTRADADSQHVAVTPHRGRALLDALVPLGLVLVPAAVGVFNIERAPQLLDAARLWPIAAAAVVVAVFAVYRSAAGAVSVSERRVRVTGTKDFAIDDIHEVLPIAWVEHEGTTGVQIAMTAADGRLLAMLDASRYDPPELIGALRRFAGRVHTPLEWPAGDRRGLLRAHPELRDRRSVWLQRVQWAAVIVAIGWAVWVSFLALA